MSDSAAPQTAAHQVPLSLGFSRQEHSSELPLPSPHDWACTHIYNLKLTLKVNVKVLVAQSCLLFATPWTVQPTSLLCPWNSSGKNTGVDCHFLLQMSFPTQGWNPGLPPWRWILYHLSQQGSPKINTKTKVFFFFFKAKNTASSSLFELRIYIEHIYIISTLMSFPLSVQSQHRWWRICKEQ